MSQLSEFMFSEARSSVLPISKNAIIVSEIMVKPFHIPQHERFSRNFVKLINSISKSLPHEQNCVALKIADTESGTRYFEM